jgi:hypothetical protein
MKRSKKIKQKLRMHWHKNKNCYIFVFYALFLYITGMTELRTHVKLMISIFLTGIYIKIK